MRTVTESGSLNSQDFLDKTAHQISQDYRYRKNDRKQLEQQWDEIDRQVSMTAKPSNIDKKSGRAAPGSEWMPFIELPWQAQTLELIPADARRLQFPSERKWFFAIAHDSDEALMRAEQELNAQGFTGAVNADALNSIVEAVHLHFQSLYDFRGEFDRLNISATAYGTLVGRMRPNRIRTHSPDYRTTISDKGKVPILTAYPIRNTFLDDTPVAAQRAGVNVSPAEIFTFHQRWEDLRIAAKRGSTDPMDENGGWLPGQLKDLSPDPDTHQVQLLEWEGDLLVDVSDDETRFVERALVTVVLANSGKEAVERVIRLRKSQMPSYVTHPYHVDNPSTRYGSSPLMKGAPIQLAASEMFSRMTQAGILNVEPPISWRPVSAFSAINGGPDITPRALWEDASGSITVHQIGDPLALMQAWLALKAEYSTVTGTDAPRLGQQTKSHQTAFAVDTELQRGVVRTVDYVRSMLENVGKSILHMEYAYAKKILRKPMPIYVPDFKQWVNVSSNMLPDAVIYDVYGSGTPIEEQGRLNKKLAAINMLAQIDQFAVQVDFPASDWNAIRKEIAKDGGLESDITPQPEGGALSAPGSGGVPGGDQEAAGDPFIRLAAGTTALGG